MRSFLRKIIHRASFCIRFLQMEAFVRFLLNLAYFLKSEKIYQLNSIPSYSNRKSFHSYISSSYISTQEEIHFLEFGVFKGEIFKHWNSENQNQRSQFHGFDTFTGLPGNWGNKKAGSYSADGALPEIEDGRASFHVGLIQNTLPVFLKTYENQVRKIIHLDVDLYDATLFTLLELQPFLQARDILIFDEFFSLTKSDHEYRAFEDFLSLFPMEYKSLVKSRNGQFAIELIS